MTEAVYSWVKNLVFYFIFVSTIINLIPDQKYRKYVRFFLGVLLVILIIKPVIGWLGLEDTLVENYYLESLENQWEENRSQIEIDVGQERAG